MTSYDLLATAFAVHPHPAGDPPLEGVRAVEAFVRRRGDEFRLTPCIGRSHGIHAEPITFGLKLLSWFAEIKRCRARLERAIEQVARGKISGAVGTYASLP